MLLLVFFGLVVVSVFCGHRTAGATITGKAETLNCLTEMNEARVAAGLPEFGNATQTGQMLPEHSPSELDITPETLWEQICKKIFRSSEIDQLAGTPAYYAGDKDCKAAVQYWKDGFSLFNNELPPTYQALNDPDVYTDKAVSFVALYNPQANPVASCAFVTCTKATAFAVQDISKSPNGQSPRRLQEENQTAKAVICLTNPKALTAGQSPFKEEEWKKIVHAIVGTEEVNRVPSVRPSITLGFIMMLFACGLF
ncbi:SAG family member [Eimeria necatrix]|uniref:SAG family member n=1 Tax=Eimeria necatrix TaxID=51315 RepID=U6MNC7_9EIME|nr:SAG family member [Eimeria necatrix]CDJ63160.1 SAG family member [Eimeria necatrix]